MIVHADIVQHLVTEFFIKAAIVGVGLAVAVVAMAILWRTLGRSQDQGGTRDNDEQKPKTATSPED